MDHYELVQEMGSVERMATQDRLKHAKKRRAQQMKKWTQYERQLEKESTKKKKSQDKHQQQKPPRKSNKGNVQFAPNIALLEAAARNDLAEGGWFCLIIMIMIIIFIRVLYVTGEKLSVMIIGNIFTFGYVIGQQVLIIIIGYLFTCVLQMSNVWSPKIFFSFR